MSRFLLQLQAIHTQKLLLPVWALPRGALFIDPLLSRNGFFNRNFSSCLIVIDGLDEWINLLLYKFPRGDELTEEATADF